MLTQQVKTIFKVLLFGPFILPGSAFSQACVGLACPRTYNSVINGLGAIPSSFSRSFSTRNNSFLTDVSETDFLKLTSYLPPETDLRIIAAEMEGVHNYCLPPQTEIENLGDAINWPACFERRVVSTDNSQNSNFDLLQQDLDICNCLKGSPLTPVQDVMAGNLLGNQSYQSVASAIQTEMTNGQDFNQDFVDRDLKQTMNGLRFQIHYVTNDVPLTFSYSQSMFTSSGGPPVTLIRDGERAAGHRLNFTDFMPKNENESGLVNNDLLRRESSQYEVGQCLSPRDYVSARQFPDNLDPEGDIVAKELRLETLNPLNWDFARLEAQYRGLMANSLERRQGPLREGIIQLKAQLRFLNRNPLLKYILGAREDDVDALLAGGQLNTQDAEKFRQQFKEVDWSSLRTGLLEVMKDLSKDDCLESRGNCRANYTQRLGAFINDHPQMLPAMNLAAHRDILRRTNRRINDRDLLATAETEVTQTAIIGEFVRRYNLPSPDTCRGPLSNEKEIDCLDIFAGYCKVLSTRASEIQRLAPNEDLAIADNLDELLAQDFDTNLSNPDFRAANDIACNVRRGGGFLQRGESMKQFADRFCRDSQNSKSCPLNRPERWTTMVKQYREKFSGEVSPDFGGAQGITDAELAKYTKSQTGDLFSSWESHQKTSSSRLSSLAQKSTRDLHPIPNSDVPDSRGPNEAAQIPAPVTGASNFGPGSYLPSSGAIASSRPKIEEMSQEDRQDLLEDWEENYQNWRTERGSELTPTDVTTNAAMQNEINTLRALLAQQQDVTRDQYKMLNDAIAGREREVAQRRAQTEGSRQEGRDGQSSERTETMRAPASVGNVSAPSSNIGPAPVPASVPAGRASVSTNNQDTASSRSTSLVKLARATDGTVVIESPGAAGNTSPNAISVPVSDEQYRILLANPTGLNLSEIQRQISPEQIAQIERNGEIILLLRNGENPPFEVKVRKESDRLVYSTRDGNGAVQVPVTRVYTRQALEDITRGLTN